MSLPQTAVKGNLGQVQEEWDLYQAL